MTEQEQAEMARLRAENAALRAAMIAIRALTEVHIPAAGPVAAEPAPDEPVADEPPTGERLLAAMRSPALFPRAPKLRVQGGYREPLWLAPACPVEDRVRVGRFAFQRRDAAGDMITLDRTAAHLSAASTVEEAHGPLQDAGEIPFDPSLVGYFKVPYFDWDEEGTPHPFGSAAAEGHKTGHAWLPHPRVRLLADLGRDGRWPELGDMPAWVSPHKARLKEWAAHVNNLRCAAIDEHGRGEEYEQVKAAFSAAITAMGGSWVPGQGRQFKTGLVHRPDWTYAIHDFSSVMMWRWFDRLRNLAIIRGHREWAPVAIQAEDEMVIPAGGLELFTTVKAAGAAHPMVIDQDGRKLGTWKIKAQS